MNIERKTTKRLSREDDLTTQDVVTKSEMKEEDVAPLPLSPPNPWTPTPHFELKSSALISLEEHFMPHHLQIAPDEEVKEHLQKERYARIISWREEVRSQSAIAKHGELTRLFDEHFYDQATTRGVAILNHALVTTEARTLVDCIALQFNKRHEKRRLPIWFAIDSILKRRVERPSETTFNLITPLLGRLHEWVSKYFTPRLMRGTQGPQYHRMVSTWEVCMRKELYESIIGILDSYFNTGISKYTHNL